MTILIEDIENKIRNRSVHPRLKRILIAAGELSGVDTVRVTSGGQMSLSEAKARGATKAARTQEWRLPNGRVVRIGSTRHDDGKAVDLKLEVDGKAQDFTTSSGRKVFEDYAEHAVALGCTGLGAGENYMGAFTMHVGFGAPAVWAQKNAPAPDWLARAAARGRANPIEIDIISAQPDLDPTGVGHRRVAARSGLRLRGGPGVNFQILGKLDFGVELDVIDREGDWAKVDLLFDGTPDGFVHSAFLQPA